jgi:hypothetical protein
MSNCNLTERLPNFLGEKSFMNNDDLLDYLIKICSKFNGTDCPCSKFADTFEPYCSSSSPESARLLPPDCSSIAGNGDDSYDLPFLTWTLVDSYQRSGNGFVGGLHGDDEYSSWACISLPSCKMQGITYDDTTCFKYSHVMWTFYPLLAHNEAC